MTRTVLLLLLVLTAVAVRPQANPQNPGSISLPKELDRVLRDYEAGWAKGDGKALALLFTLDGFVLQPGKPPIQGREAIEKLYQGSGSPLALRAFAVGVDGNVGYILGGFARTAGEPDSGKFTLTLRKVDGKWLIASDMDSPNQPRG